MIIFLMSLFLLNLKNLRFQQLAITNGDFMNFQVFKNLGRSRFQNQVYYKFSFSNENS